MDRPIETVPDFYAHALAIEREAATRYREFAAQMADHDNEELSSLFERLARLEQDHARLLEQKAAGMSLPDLPAERYAWLDAAAPETAAHEWVLRMMSPFDVLRIALEGETRARAFFDRLGKSAADPAIRALALEMAAEEAEHAARLERALAHYPNPVIDWEKVFGTDRRPE